MIISGVDVPTDPQSLAMIAAGFFFVMWIVALRKKPREKRWYSTEMPSTLHIEREA
jgi:hypothetical protein